LDLLRSKLTERGVRCDTGENKEELYREIYRILYREEKMKMEQMEKLFFPFEQSGFLNAEQKLALLLYQTEKKNTGGGIGKLLKELVNQEEEIITERRVDAYYIQQRKEGKCFFSWEEKKNFFALRLLDRFGAGVVELLNRIGGDELLLGEFCPNTKEEILEKTENKIGIRRGSRILRFPFLKITEEELERVIRVIITREKMGEITMQNPVWRKECPDGRKMKAIRPPGSENWGLIIQYKEEGGGYK